MTIVKNCAGGTSIRIGKFSVFTDPIDRKTFSFIKDKFHIAIYFGPINFNWERYRARG